jgi:hypothetical protein
VAQVIVEPLPPDATAEAGAALDASPSDAQPIDAATDAGRDSTLSDSGASDARDAAFEAAVDSGLQPVCNPAGLFGNPKPVYEAPNTQPSAQGFRVAKQGTRAYFFRPDAASIDGADLTAASTVMVGGATAQIQPLAAAPTGFDISEDETELLLTLQGQALSLVSRANPSAVFSNALPFTPFAPVQAPGAALERVMGGSFYGSKNLLMSYLTFGPSTIRTYEVPRVPPTPVGAPLELRGQVPSTNSYPTFEAFTAVRSETEVYFARWGADSAYARIYNVTRSGALGAWGTPALLSVENFAPGSTDHVVPFDVSDDGCTMYFGKGPIDGPFLVYQASKPKN